MNESTVDLLVVGAGLGGLVAAATASHQGRSVLVLEQNENPGGLARSPAVNGVPMNLGAHALYLDGPAAQTLRALGLPLKGFRSVASAHLEETGRLRALPQSPLGLLTMSWLTWRERLELALTMRAILSEEAPEGTTAHWLGSIRSPRVRAFIETFVRLSTYTNATQSLPASLAHAQLRVLFKPTSQGVSYLDGGWQSLVDELKVLVPIRTGARVTHVSADGVATLANGETIRGHKVAIAVPLATAAQLVDDDSLRQRAASAVPVRAACLDLVLKRLPQPRTRIVLGLDQSLYFSVHSRPDATEAVKVHVAWYLAPDDTQSPTQLRERLEAFVDRAQPGWRSLCEGARFFPHLKVMDDLPRQEVTRLRAPLELISTVASTKFLFDAVVSSIGSTAS